MKPHEETWSVKGCGNEWHGPTWTCWKVVDERGAVVLKGVDKATADRYAMLPEIARALLPIAERRCESLPTLERECQRLWGDPAEWCPTCCARKVLTKAGVLP